MSDSSHIRGQIRAAFAAAASIPELGGRVFQARAWPLAAEDLPCALVHVDGETIETRQTGSRRIQSRRASVVVALLVKHSDDVEDQIDSLSAKIETSILTNQALASLSRDLSIVATDSTINADGALVVGQHRMLFAAEVPALEGDPTRRAP